MKVFQIKFVLFFLATAMNVVKLCSAMSNHSCDVEQCFKNLLYNVDIATIDDFNTNELFPRLQVLLRRDYFRYFQYNSKRSCPFWNETLSGKCNLVSCRVTACKVNELPLGLQFSSKGVDSTTECAVGGNNITDNVDVTLRDDVRQDLLSWQAHDAATINFCEPDGCVDCDFVDLTLNPERHTGYSGEPSRKIWRAVYQSNGIQSVTNKKSQKSCLEQSAFYCAVSGLHSSISVHIASQYRVSYGVPYAPLLDGFDQNPAEFLRRFDPRLTKGRGPIWLRNLYFVYLLELRALSKIGTFLQKQHFFTGNSEEDETTQIQVKNLVALIQSFPNPFNETFLLKTRSLESNFFNVSRVMDCVECDKCKLWGKLQVTKFHQPYVNRTLKLDHFE